MENYRLSICGFFLKCRICDDYYEVIYWIIINCMNFNYELWVIYIKECGFMLSIGRYRLVDYFVIWFS